MPSRPPSLAAREFEKARTRALNHAQSVAAAELHAQQEAARVEALRLQTAKVYNAAERARALAVAAAEKTERQRIHIESDRARLSQALRRVITTLGAAERAGESVAPSELLRVLRLELGDEHVDGVIAKYTG